MRKLEVFVILDVIVMVFSGVVAYVLNYVGMLDDSPYAGLSSGLGWYVVFAIISLIASALLALILSIIIIHKITQNMRKLKRFALLDGIATIISWGLIHILGYVGMNSRTTYAGLPLRMGWNIVFEIIFLITSVLLVLALCIIIIHKIVHKVIQKIRKIKNRI